MLKRVVKWSALALLLVATVVVVFIVCLRASPIPVHELDSAWYHTQHGWSESLAKTLGGKHRLAIARAEADHFVLPIGPSRVVRLMDASSDSSGDVFLRFIARHFSSSADIHLLIVYCWSSHDRRFLWKAVEDHSP